MSETKGFGSTWAVVGVPAAGRLTTVHWGINLAAQKFPLNTAVDFCCPEGFDSDRAREIIVQMAFERNAKYIWMLDDDVLPPDIAFQRLAFSMKKKELDSQGNWTKNYVDDPEVMVSAGIYYSKSDVPQPVVFEGPGMGAYWDWKQGEVFELPKPGGFIGAGCMLIKTELFRKLEQPWFLNVDEPKTTDDAYFCRKVHEAGFKILGHGGVLCGHYDHKRRKVTWPPGAMFIPEEVSA